MITYDTRQLKVGITTASLLIVAILALAVSRGEASREAEAGLIAYERSGGGESSVLYVMNPDGTDRTRVVDLGFLAGFTWASDGRRLLITEYQKGLSVVNADGTGLRRIARGEFDEVTPSPDGRKIAFVRDAKGGLASFIYTMNSDGTETQRLAPGFGLDFCRNPAWSPDSRRLAYTCNAPTGVARDLFVMNADGSDQRRLTRHQAGSVSHPTWSPGGRRIAFQGEVRDDFDSQYDIYVINADGSRLENLTADEATDGSPTWSPTGRWILFTSRGDVHTIRSDGRRHRNLTRMRGNDGSPCWSPSGRAVAFDSKRDGDWDIYLMSATGRQVTNITNSPRGASSLYPLWSPRG